MGPSTSPFLIFQHDTVVGLDEGFGNFAVVVFLLHFDDFLHLAFESIVPALHH